MFNKLIKYRLREEGQVILVVVLVMVIALTVGLSIASRSITNIRTSTEEVSSQQALSAAEAGVEQILRTKTSIATGSLSNDTTYSTEITSVEGTSFLVNGGSLISKNDSADLWLSEYSTQSASLYSNPWSGDVTIYWGTNSDGCKNAALEIAVVSGSKNAPKVTKYGFDPCSTRASSNSLTLVQTSPSQLGEKTFYNKTTISVSSGLIARIVPLYTGSVIGVSGNSALPSQGFIVSSTGKSQDTERKINVFQGYPKLPAEFFPYGIFSP